VLTRRARCRLLQELVDNYKPEYIAGGATQNAIRVAQWMLQVPGAVSYFVRAPRECAGAAAPAHATGALHAQRCATTRRRRVTRSPPLRSLTAPLVPGSPRLCQGAVGTDDFSAKMEGVAKGDGVSVNYLKADAPTGKCAVLIVDGERSLVAALGAAEAYQMSHVEANWAVVEAARFFYISAFFMTHSAAVIMKLAQHSAEARKCFAMNLAAPFIMQVPPFKAALTAAMPYIDLLIGNEHEAAAFAASESWPDNLSMSDIALRISALPKASGHRGRVVVITQGCEPTVVAQSGSVTLHPIIALAKEQLVDTNGAGDAFVGGLLSQLVAGKDLSEACRAGNYAAHTIIQRSGCTVPDTPDFTWA
jgi:adenosine kinase